MFEQKISIENQEVKDNGRLYNIAKQENNYFDDPLEYYFKIEIGDDENLKSVYDVIKYITNKNKLKEKFINDYSRYIELIELAKELTTLNSENKFISSKNLDDGYKSVISSILNICRIFQVDTENDKKSLCVRENKFITASIEALSLKIGFKDIKSRKVYIETKTYAEKLKKHIAPFMICSNQYGGFLQFTDIYIEAPKNLPFIDKEAKFTTSDNIIPKLIQPLYGDSPECGLRELIQNACDACKQIQKKYCNIDSFVEIYLDKEFESSNWILKIRDYGIGMDEKILINKYFVIGESTKRDSNENLVGQFGIGALATFLLGNKMELKTKKYGQQNILSFEYEYKFGDNVVDDGGIEIKICSEHSFEHGTEVIITLKDKFNVYSIEDLERILKINEWYLMSDIELKYYVNGNEKQMITLKGEKYKWETVIKNDSLLVEYLLPDSERQDENLPFGKVIYNGILIPKEYCCNDKYIKYKPCVNIVDKGRNIEIDLSRKEIHNSDIFSKKLESNLYSKVINALNKTKGEGDVIQGLNIRSFTYESEYMKNIPLFFCRDGFGVYSKTSLKRIQQIGKYRYIIQVFDFYNYGKKLNLEELNDDCIYVFDYQSLSKSYISDLISLSGQTILPREVLKKYFYLADSSNTGFKKETIQYLYRYFNIPLPVNSSARAIWDYHNEHKDELFRNLFENEYINIEKGLSYNIDISNITNVCITPIIQISSISNICIRHDEDIIQIDDFGIEILDYYQN